MRIAENWKDYKIIDTSSGDKLESWGGKVLVRPDPQIIWKSPKRSDLWTKADGRKTAIIIAAPRAAANGNTESACLKVGTSAIRI